MTNLAGYVGRATSAALARRLAGAAAVAVVTTMIGKLVVGGTSLRLAVVAVMVALALGLWAFKPASLVYLLVSWTVILGVLRRVLTYKLFAAPTGTDPLLVVEPFALVLLAVAAIKVGVVRPRTRLSTAVTLLAILIVLGAVNPVQGSLSAGLAALTFFVPVGAFWAGRLLLDDTTYRRSLLLVGFLVVPAALYGLAQAFLGFPSWDLAWIKDLGYSALNIGNTVRQFSAFTSAAEYGTFLVVGTVVWAWLGPRGPARAVGLAIIGLLLTALVLESSRGIIFALVATTGLLFAARRKLPLRNAALVSLLAIFLLPVVVSKVAPTPSNAYAPGTGALVSHQVTGLSDPTGRQSTLFGHIQLIVEGLKSTVTNPVGHGISRVTIAGDKYGVITHGTEADVSNAGVAMGLPGLLVILVIIWEAFTRGYRVACLRQDPLAFAALGVLGVTFLQWLNGGQYSISFLAWLAIGWIDRSAQELESSASTATGGGAAA